MSSTTNTIDTPSGLRRRRRLLIGLVAALALVPACGSGGSDAPTTTAAPETTTTTEVSAEEAGEAFQDLVDEAGGAVDDENAARDEFASVNDLDGALESAADLAPELDAFQADLAQLEVPEDAQEAVDELDGATTEFVEVLEGYADVADIDGYNEQLDLERDAEDAWRDAVADVADVLGTDGLEESGGTNGSDDPADPEVEGASSPIAGDGSEYCLQDGDLPEGYLPLSGQDNLSNALEYGFGDGPEADYADALVASWMVLPDGGAGPTDVTADCTIHLFDTPESAAGFYDAWTQDYGADSFPVPEEVEVAADAPGDDPHAYRVDVGGRPQATQIFLYENVVVNVGISAPSSVDDETLLAGINGIAQVVFDRVEAAA